MAGNDEHIAAGDTAALLDSLARGEHRRAVQKQRVEAHESHARRPVVEDNRAHFARIVQLRMERLAVSARLLHSKFGRDIALGQACLKDAIDFRLSGARWSKKAKDNRERNGKGVAIRGSTQYQAKQHGQNFLGRSEFTSRSSS